MHKTVRAGLGVAMILGVLAGAAVGCSPGARKTVAPPTPTPAAKKSAIRGLQQGAIATPGPNELLLDANADPLFGDAPLIVRFSAAPFDKRDAKNPTYRWSFGDGTPDSTEQNPVHTYAKPGDYSARVDVWEAGGKSGSEEFDLSVFAPDE